MAKKKKIPEWVIEFRKEINELKKKTRNGNIYNKSQESWQTLKETGRGNCVATSDLFENILSKYKPEFAYRMTTEVIDKRCKNTHRIIIVIETTDRYWYQSNDKITFFDNIFDLLRCSAKGVGWEKRGFCPPETHKIVW